MSTELESVIRPFQSGSISPAQTYFPAGEVGVPNVKLQYGRGGSGKSVSGSFSLTIASYCEKAQTEKKRQGGDDLFRVRRLGLPQLDRGEKGSER